MNMNDKSSKVNVTEHELKQIVGGTEPSPAPVPEPAPVSADSVVSRAIHEIGKPYAWGSVGPDAYDCSGLVSYCLTGTHAHIGTTTTFMSWPRVANPIPGDICTSANHCGIYVGQGQMIHAPGFGQSVCYGSIQSDMIIVRK